jgi:cystathionine beta-synthase
VEITPNSFYANQYFNEDNLLAHYDVTGPEIQQQMGDDLYAIVAGVGTGGTMSGIGRYYKEHQPDVQIVGVDPVGSILYDLFHYKEVRDPAHTYKIEGVGEDMLPGNVDFTVMDDFIKVTDHEAFSMCQELLRKEGICAGPSSAMAVVGAAKYAATLPDDKPQTIVVIIPDHGRAYLSKAFNEDWLRENDFLPNPLTTTTLGDLLADSDVPAKVFSADVGQSVLDVVSLM